MNNELGKNIRELIRHKRMTQRELAERTGITTSSISRYIKGERIPNSEILVKIASALNTDTNSLLGIENKDELSELDFETLKRIVARFTDFLSQKQKADLILAIMGVNND